MLNEISNPYDDVLEILMIIASVPVCVADFFRRKICTSTQDIIFWKEVVIVLHKLMVINHLAF